MQLQMPSIFLPYGMYQHRTKTVLLYCIGIIIYFFATTVHKVAGNNLFPPFPGGIAWQLHVAGQLTHKSCPVKFTVHC